MEKIEGSFDFESLMVYLFRNDIGDTLEEPDDDLMANLADIFFEVASESWAKLGCDTVPTSHLPEHLLKNNATLFHERIHYWQLISCPMLQYKFLNHFDNLRWNVRELGGSTNHFLGRDSGFFDRQANKKNLEYIAANFAEYDLTLSFDEIKAEIRKPGQIEKKFGKVKFLNRTPITYWAGQSAYASAAQINMLLPLRENDELPAYAAELCFMGNPKIFFIPFTAKYLIECSAYLSQLLYEKKALPTVSDLSDHNDRLYLGIYEYWFRLYDSLYDNKVEMIYALLAVIDLAITTDLFPEEILDGDFYHEMLSIPYRFGRLSYICRTIPKFELKEGTSLSMEIARYQNDCCHRMSWPKIDFGLKKMAIFLAVKLIVTGEDPGDFERQHPAIAKELSEKSLDQLADNYNNYGLLWEYLFKKQTPLLGYSIVGTMLNACFYRIGHPGEFALHHTYFQEMQSLFPLPLVLYQGKYYDEKYLSIQCNYPINVTSPNLQMDMVHLLTLKPLKDGKMHQCGFLGEFVDCSYIKAGFGCPLCESENIKRKEMGLDDFCHFTYQAVLTKLGKDEMVRRWEKIWRKNLQIGEI